MAPNGANLVIESPIAEEVFTSLGIDDRKVVVVYGEYMDPSAMFAPELLPITDNSISLDLSKASLNPDVDI